MRIALFSETYYPQVNGVATHVRLLKEGLEATGHEVLVVTAGKEKEYILRDNILYCPGTQLKKIYNYKVSAPFSAERFRYIKEFRPDVIHVHNEFGIGYSGVAFARRLRIPVVYTLHTEYDKAIFYISNPTMEQFVQRISHMYMNYFGKKADMITSPSAKSVEYLRRIGIRKEILVIPNCADMDLFAPKSNNEAERLAFRSAHQCNEDDLIYVFVGRVGREKSIDVLIRYWLEAKLKDTQARLWIIGDGPDRSELEKLVELQGMSSYISFMGNVDHSQIPEFLHACDFYVTASLSEMHSISMLEAMGSGLPVLQRRDQLNQSQIQEGVNGFFYDTPEDFSKLLNKTLNLSKEERKDLSEKTIHSVRNDGKIKQAEKLLKVYREAIKRKKAYYR